jgi:hypothetical protein
MFISHRISTQYGPGLVSHPRRLTIPDDPAAALAFARQQDRAADVMLSEGRFEAAERLSHAALEARARATGCRA